ncbi:unnamed protein product [Lampetra planeri]
MSRGWRRELAGEPRVGNPTERGETTALHGDGVRSEPALGAGSRSQVTEPAHGARSPWSSEMDLWRPSREGCGEKRLASVCVGCGAQIRDPFILRVSPDLEWHASCLKCAECAQYLDETCTCFVRDGKTYCKRDYVRPCPYAGPVYNLDNGAALSLATRRPCPLASVPRDPSWVTWRT